MASNIFGIGTSGLLTAQRQLATASHNISNVNTEGYARQRAEQAARLPNFTGNGYIGSGADVQTTIRLANEFLEEQIRVANSQFGQYESYNRLSKQIDNILANPDSGLTPTLESFFSALQEANDNPASTPARQVLLTEANTLTERFKLLDDRFIQLNAQVNQDLVDVTQEVTDLARSLANINADIVKRIGAGQGDLPNDLIDQREHLIKQVSEKIDVKVIYQDDGAANLFIGSGQTLVVGNVYGTLGTAVSPFNAEDLRITLTQGVGIVDVSNAITGGELQGVLDFKNDVLEPSRRSLGRIAMALSEEMNAQHKLGMTLQDTGAGFRMGGDFFTDLSGPILGLPGQVGTGEVSFNISDSRILTTSNYQLDYDGAIFTLTRLDDNVSFTGATLADLNNQIDDTLPTYIGTDPQGFSFSTAAPIPPATAPAAGEKFLIRPTFEASVNFDVAVNNVLDIALAAPVISGAVTNADGSALNSGNGDISLPVTTTSAASGVLTDSLTSLPITLDFEATNANEFDINLPVTATVSYVDATGTAQTIAAPVTALPYNPATDSGGITYSINYNSGDVTTFTIHGVPNSNDQLELSVNSAPYDDNRNGLLMAQLQTAKTLENSSTDFQAGYAMIVSDVGTKTHSSEVDLLAQQTLSEQAIAERESYSGVNLDEEAADLLKFQQAYQAAARVISTADDMFQALIAAV